MAPVIIACLLLAIVVVSTAAFLKLILRTLPFSFSSISDTIVLLPSERMLRQLQSLWNAGNHEEALTKLVRCFTFRVVDNVRSLPDKILQHHLGVLETVITFAADKKNKLSNLPVLEELLHKRTDLMKARSETKLKRRRLRVKVRSFRNRKSSFEALIKSCARKQVDQSDHAGSSTTGDSNWAAKELTRSIIDLEAQLEVNRRAIVSQLEELVRLLSQDSSSEMQLH